MAKTKVIATRNQQSDECSKKQDGSNGTEPEPEPAAGETL